MSNRADFNLLFPERTVVELWHLWCLQEITRINLDLRSISQWSEDHLRHYTYSRVSTVFTVNSEREREREREVGTEVVTVRQRGTDANRQREKENIYERHVKLNNWPMRDTQWISTRINTSARISVAWGAMLFFPPCRMLYSAFIRPLLCLSGRCIKRCAASIFSVTEQRAALPFQISL